MEQTPKKNSERQYYLFALRIAGDFGATIAVPVVIFAVIGQYFDKKYSSEPLFLVGGFVLAFILSSLSIYRKAKKYGNIYQKLK